MLQHAYACQTRGDLMGMQSDVALAGLLHGAPNMRMLPRPKLTLLAMRFDVALAGTQGRVLDS